MATISEAASNAATDAIVDLVDVGTTNSSGRLVFRTSGDVEVATLPMSNPAFGNAATRVATAGAITSDTNATGGVIANSIITDRDNVTVISPTVGTSGQDINLSSLTIAAGDTVSMSSLTATGPN